MPLTYDSKDAATEVFPPGEYQGTLKKCEEAVSKKGNAMAVLTWEVFGPGESTQFLKDYIVLPSGIWKIGKLAEAWGRSHEFNANIFQPEDMIGENLTLILKVEKKDDFPERNVIGAYKPFERPMTTPSEDNEDVKDDPF